MIFLSFASWAKTCYIESHRKIFKINKILDSSLVKDSDCKQEVVQTFTSFLSGASGSLSRHHLARMFKNEYGHDILFKNDIQVKELKELIESELSLKGTVITRLTSLYGRASLNLDGNQKLVFECPSCDKPGERNIKLSINGQTLWLSSEIKVKRSGFKLLRDVSPFDQELSSEMVELTTALDDGKSQIFSDVERIDFYRPNRPLNKGRVLRITDLSPKNLVKFNQNVEVFLKGKNITLKTKATSRQNGKYGDTVRLYNPKTKKNISGKVIDFNTVMVEL